MTKDPECKNRAEDTARLLAVDGATKKDKF